MIIIGKYLVSAADLQFLFSVGYLKLGIVKYLYWLKL